MKSWFKEEKMPIQITRDAKTQNTMSINEASYAAFTWTCLDLRGRSIAGLDWVVKKNGEDVEESWLINLLKRPNSYLNNSTLLKLITNYLDLYGNCYINIQKAGNLPAALWVLPSNGVTVKIDGGIKGYTYREQAEMYFPREEIIHFKAVKPGLKMDELLIGKSLVERALSPIMTAKELDGFINRYFQNNGLPPFVYFTDTELTNDQYNLYAARFNQHDIKLAANISTSDRLEPLQGAQTIGTNSSMLPQISEMTQKLISQTFGIPLAKITGDSQNYATANITQISFIKDTIAPLAYDIAETITNFAQMFEDGLTFEFLVPNVLDETLELQKQAQRVNLGLTNRNEEREKLGLEPIDGGDVYLVQSSLMPVDKVLNPDPVTFGMKKKMMFDDLSEEEKTVLWKKADDFAESQEPPLKKAWIKLINDIEKDYTKSFDLNKWSELLSNYFSEPLKEVIINNLKFALEQISQGWSGVSFFDTEIKDLISAQLERYGLSLQTIQEELFNIETKPEEDARELVKRQFDIYRDSRAELVTKTATTFVRGASQEIAWKDDVDYVWLSMRDSRVRDSHKKADGQIRKDGYFRVGSDKMPFPAGGSRIEENVRCRCTMLPQKKKSP